MLKHSNRYYFIFILILFIIVTCTACQDKRDIYLIGQFFDDLAFKSGLMYEESNSEEALVKWGVLENKKYNLNEEIRYDLFSEVIINMLEIDDSDYLGVLKDKKWVHDNTDVIDVVKREDAHKIIDETLDIINNKHFDNGYYFGFDDEFEVVDFSLRDDESKLKKSDRYKYIYSQKDEQLYKVDKDNKGYNFNECEIEDALSNLYLSSSDYVDLDEVIIEPYGEIIDSSIFKDEYKLLSNKTNVFHIEGFRISYSISTSKIRFYVSKKTKQNINVYSEFSLYDIKPSFNWEFEKGNIKYAYFKLDYNSLESFGLSVGKYKDFNIDIKDLDDSSILNMIKSSLKTNDKIESTIPLCKIKIPIKEIPFVYLNMDLSLHIYASGKVEIKVSNMHTVGFEVKNNTIRFISDHKHDVDAIINASFNTSIGFDLHLDAFNQKLMNINTEAGVRAYVQSILHLYDENGDFQTYDVDETCDVLNNALDEDDIRVCGDLSFHWLLNVDVNSQDSLLGKLGLSKTFEILDDDNQVFNNMSHIENGHFVEKCTRKGRLVTTSIKQINSDKILLEKYSMVVQKGSSLVVPIYALPSGYKQSDLIYECLNKDICTVDGNTINTHMAGATIIMVKTSDKKYEVSFNILVSDG